MKDDGRSAGSRVVTRFADSLLLACLNRQRLVFKAVKHSPELPTSARRLAVGHRRAVLGALNKTPHQAGGSQNEGREATPQTAALSRVCPMGPLMHLSAQVEAPAW